MARKSPEHAPILQVHAPEDAPRPPPIAELARDWLVGGGEMGALIRSTDWSGTPLGPRDAWPQSLRTTVRLLVESPFPQALLWGRELILLYNDAYRLIAAERHPRALGRSTREVWPEVWGIDEPIFSAVLERGESAVFEDKVYPLEQDGERRDAHFTISYSPVRLEDAGVGGCLVTLLDTTRRVQQRQAIEIERDGAAAVVAERELLSALVRSIPDEVWFADPQRRFTLANPAAQRQFALDGTPLDVERLATRLEVLRPDGTPRPVDEAPPLRALRGETIVNEEEQVRTPAGGALRWRQVSASPVRNAEGVILGSVSITRDITDRKRAEQAIAESEQRLAAFFDHAPAIVWIKDLEGRFLRVSRYAEQLLGKRAEELVGRTVADLYPGPEADPYASNDRKVIAAGAAMEFEERLDLPDGPHTFQSFKFPLRDAAGRICGLGAICNDVTVRLRAEQERRESDARLQLTLQASAVGTFEVDLTTGVGRWNAIEYALLGLEPGALPGNPETFFRYVHPQDVAALRARWEEATRTGVLDSEFRVVRADGQERWLVGRGQFAFTDEAPTGAGERGPPVRFLGVNFDITDRKRAEEAARESEALLRAVIDTVAEPIYVKDTGSRITLANAATLATVGRPADAIIGHTDRELFDDPALGNAILEHDRDVMESGAVQVHEETIEGPQGRRVLLNTKAPRRDASGRVVGLVGVARDITDRKRAEEALRAANARLQQADRRKDEFLATLSHELRNPLAPISNCLYVLDRAEPGGAQARRAKEILDRQVAQLARIVNDLLDVTRVTQNKIHLQRERADLCELVGRSAEDQRSLFDGGQLKLEVDVPGAPVFVDVDPTRIAQVLGNLLQNAAKFTRGAGLARVSVSADLPAGQAVVRVSDTGVGMDADTIAGLFQPFVQADHTLERSAGGLGLGLALVKGLVELHGGTVSAHSDGPGQGAEFVVRLPLAGAAGPRAPLAAPPSPRRVRILLIEDNVDAAESLREVLELSGHEVLVALDGPDGIAKARDFRPSFVFCDIGLPGMDGYAVARALRGDEALKDVHLVALSGYAQPHDLQRASEAGFEKHIVKPPSLTTIAAVLAGAEVPAKE